MWTCGRLSASSKETHLPGWYLGVYTWRSHVFQAVQAYIAYRNGLIPPPNPATSVPLTYFQTNRHSSSWYNKFSHFNFLRYLPNSCRGTRSTCNARLICLYDRAFHHKHDMKIEASLIGKSGTIQRDHRPYNCTWLSKFCPCMILPQNHTGSRQKSHETRE